MIAKSVIEQIEDILAVEQAMPGEVHRMRERITLTRRGWTTAEVDAMFDLRQQCEQAVTTAMACCRCVSIEDGVVRCDGSQAERYQRRLERFNRILPPHTVSYAAFVFERMRCG
ncbi:hypothetical protein [Neorhodopirellula pilleata]|uniref:Uncharacterized protein n=1 Tax=Neorhodopirellula pilleata TaxID=2714738 RepID=A0A5C5ZLZ8_9BACT|nr:hypothetical protein [Neorhodopirellula pilleata]TWT88007.1 hypothetical protein Pla100_57370 [Neorhodopirellula pilleata]